jgi:preprotein translocase subunit YajC
MHGGKDAAGWAIMTMLVIIIPMLIAVGFFIFRIAKRQRIHSDSQYNDPFLNDHQSNK